MLPFVDMHCHLVAGADDGPRTLAEAIEMCDILVAEGAGTVLGLAHQNEYYPDVTPSRILSGIAELTTELKSQKSSLVVYPGAEVMIAPDTVEALADEKLLTLAGRRQFLLIEMPHGLFIDLRDSIYRLRQLGVRTLLAHPEQVPELLHGEHLLDELVHLGCLTVVSTGNVVEQQSATDGKRLRRWFERGLVHFIGSDGHSPRRRPPLLRAACERIEAWVGPTDAARICTLNGLAVLQGLPLHVPPPRPQGGVRSWLPRFLTGR